LADFGDPTTSSEHVICLYEGRGGQPRLVFEKDVEAAELCSGQPCWEVSTKGVRYRDKKRRRRRSAVSGLDLRAGDNGRARITLKAGGVTLAPPRLPLAQDGGPVVLQLVNLDTGVCWESSFTTAKENTDTLFVAASD